MINVYNHKKHDCAQVEFRDETGSVLIHFHKSAGSGAPMPDEFRQCLVKAPEGTIMAYANPEIEPMECDPTDTEALAAVAMCENCGDTGVVRYITMGADNMDIEEMVAPCEECDMEGDFFELDT